MPGLRHVGPARSGSLVAPLQLLVRHAGLIGLLALREVRDRHAGSMLGLGWAVIQPILIFGIYLAVFGHMARLVQPAGAPSLPTDFGHYLLAGFAPWYALVTTLHSAASVVRLNAGLVKQIEFPVAVLPAKTALAQLPLLVLGLGLALGYQLLAYGHAPASLALLPPLLVLYAMLALGLAWLVAATGTFLRDLDPVIGSLSVVALYLLPLFFLPGTAPEALQPLIAWNPFSPMVAAFQDAMVFGEMRSAGSWLFLAGFAGVAFFGGFAAFAWLRPSFGDVL